MLGKSISLLHPVHYRSPLFYLPAQDISRFRRKHGLYSYKLGKIGTHKRPEAMRITSRYWLKKEGYTG